jgi:hypothetical protein
MFQELIQDAIDQGALEMLKAQIMNSIMAATGMVPGMEGGEEAAGGEGAAVQSAGGADVTSAGAPGPAAASPMGGGMLPEQLFNELVTKAFGTKLAQRRAPESDQSD